MKFAAPTYGPSRFIASALLICVSLIFTSQAETVVYSEGFENGDGGYSHLGTGDMWQWGAPLPSYTLGPASAHSGTNCWGTNLSGAIPGMTDAYLTSTAISLPALGANQVMRVRFFAWIAVDYMFDRGEFEVSKDGVNWERKAELFFVMQGGWNEYTFDISDYAGGTIFLRFRCTTDDQDYFSPPEIPFNMSGLYIDDIAITAIDAPAVKTKLTFTGWENQEEVASCPWILSWKDTSFVKDNDVFSTAWGQKKEYTDYYQLKNPPLSENGKYVLQLSETNSEVSYVDMLRLVAVDHDTGVLVASDENGNIVTYTSPQSPQSAVDNSGNDIQPLIAAADEVGYHAYNNDSMILDFANCDINGAANLIIKATGFMIDTALGTSTNIDRPLLVIQTKNEGGAWTTRNIFYPRMFSSTCGFDVHNAFVYDQKVRIVSSSCLTGKYHLIDYVGLSLDTSQTTAAKTVLPSSAIRSDNADVTGLLVEPDGAYAQMTKGQCIRLEFPIPDLLPNTARDFIVVSKGYFVPTGTFFFYTWDGAKWVQRDGWSVPEEGDQTRTFDLSQWLPDPSGEYKVRIWQDFILHPAGMNFAGLTRDTVHGVMSYATDLMTGASVLPILKDSDDVLLNWDWGIGWPYRTRWVEIGWGGLQTNLPPTTAPVSITGLDLPIPSVPIIHWTYKDPENNPQIQAVVEVWTAPNGTGYNIWNPSPILGTDTSVAYGGSALVVGHTYYARVKAFDGFGWGVWSERSFVYMQGNRPPVAEAGPAQNLNAGCRCRTQVKLDGSGSYDPDGDTLSYVWTGPFGSVIGKRPMVTLGSGETTIKLTVNDGKGGIATDSVVITIVDRTAPVPNVCRLPTITGYFSVTIHCAPTATDNCRGKISGTTTDPLTYNHPGTYFIKWKFDDGNGNVSFQTQTVIVNKWKCSISGGIPKCFSGCRV